MIDNDDEQTPDEPPDFILQDGVYYFDMGQQRIAVTAREAELSILADAVLVDGESIESRARVLARAKWRAQREQRAREQRREERGYA